MFREIGLIWRIPDNSMPLESFEPLVRRIFSREPYGLSDRALADETY